MEATTFEIIGRWRERPFAIAYVDDFDMREQGRFPANEILTNPNISLYTLDLEERRAIFVETQPSVDLNAAPFFFVAQFEHAVRVLTISFEMMIELAKSVALVEAALAADSQAGTTYAWGTVQKRKESLEPADLAGRNQP